MISFSVSAPGKVILFGEHSVVYGKTAVAASLNRRTSLEISELPESESSRACILELPKVELRIEVPVCRLRDELLANDDFPKLADVGHEPFLQAVRAFVASIIVCTRPGEEPVTTACGSLTSRQRASLDCLFFALLQVGQSEALEARPFRLRVDSELPVGAGLGSSASFAVCLVAGFLRLAQLQKSPQAPPSFTADDLEKISGYAHNCEKIMHGAPSGIDNSICTYGSVIEFRRAEQFKFISTGSARNMAILLVDTKVDRSTKALVDKVAALKIKYPQIYLPVLEAMDELAKRVVELIKNMQALQDSDDQLLDVYKEISNLININQGLLSTCQVSHPSLDFICLTAKKYGLAAKLTGAGGGGFAYILIPPNTSRNEIQNLSSKLTDNDFFVSETSLGSFGVQVYNKNFS